MWFRGMNGDGEKYKKVLCKKKKKKEVKSPLLSEEMLGVGDPGSDLTTLSYTEQ